MKNYVLLGLLLVALSYSAEASWIRRADFGSNGRHRGTGCAVGNHGYFGLGHYNGTGSNIVLKDWWEYDPATNAWSQKANYIGANGVGNYAVLTLGINGCVYVTGGAFSDLNTYRYQPTTNTWDVVAQAPANFSNTEGFVIGNKGYGIIGNVLYEFDATTLQWTAKNNTPFNAALWMGAFSIGDKGYVRSGISFYEYKPLTDQWIQRAYFPGLATAASMNFTQDGKGYVIAGYSNSLSAVNSEAWQYDPFTNTWTQLEEFPGTARRFGSAFSVGDRSFVGIGTNGTNFNDFWEFDADLITLNNEYLDISKVKMYPNPAVEEVHIDLESYQSFDATLYDMTGKRIKKETTENGHCTIYREDLPAGTYIVKISILGNVLGTKTLIFN